jgi:hypothetical protein
MYSEGMSLLHHGEVAHPEGSDLDFLLFGLEELGDRIVAFDGV